MAMADYDNAARKASSLDIGILDPLFGGSPAIDGYGPKTLSRSA